MSLEKRDVLLRLLDINWEQKLYEMLVTKINIKGVNMGKISRDRFVRNWTRLTNMNVKSKDSR